MTEIDLTAYLENCRARVDQALSEALPSPAAGDDPMRLWEGMRYSVLQGGKRMRPVVVIAACEAAGGSLEAALPACCALEMIHAYSLVHDDLPAMDNDLERRGKPTVHVEFGQAPAILVGDALLTRAFEVLADGLRQQPAAAAQGVSRLARHAGISGMVGGQALDLEHGQDIDSLELLERVHALKTGALYAAGGALGALSAGADAEQVERLERWGLAFGIAFQHADDVLDDDQAALRDQAMSRVATLVEECRGIASGYGASGAALDAIGKWVSARAERALTGDKAD